MMDKIELVKSLLGETVAIEEQTITNSQDNWSLHHGQLMPDQINRWAERIDALYQQPVSVDLLLTDEEIETAVEEAEQEKMKYKPHPKYEHIKYILSKQLAKAQLAKATPIIKSEAYREIGEWLSTHWKDIDADTVTYWCKDIATLKQGKKP